MTLVGLSFTVLYAIALTGVALGLFGILRANWLVRRAESRAEVGLAACGAALETARQDLDSVARQLQELRDQPLPAPVAKSGLNLSKRSQALRMHRRGDPPEQIAAALEIPLQEVDLLLKVHRIVTADL